MLSETERKRILEERGFLYFEELDEEAQREVIEDERDINIRDGWADEFIHDFERQLNSFGFEISKFVFEFGSKVTLLSQKAHNNRFTFSGKFTLDRDWEKSFPHDTFFDGIQKIFYDFTDHCHSISFSFEGYGETEFLISGLPNREVEKDVRKFLETIIDYIFGILHSEYDYLISDREIAQTIIDRGTEFHVRKTEEGL